MRLSARLLTLGIKIVSLSTLIGLTAICFQNCGTRFKARTFEQSSHQPHTAIGRSCRFDAQDVAPGASVIAFQNSTVPYGTTCVSESRKCIDGTLDGSYTFASCNPGQPASCLFNGQTVSSGSSVDAYQNSTVPFGTACVKESRACTDGALAGSFTFSNCRVNDPAACTFNGETIASGLTKKAYKHSTVTSPATCESEDRVCMNGNLSGSFQFASCVENQPAACLFHDITVPSGSSVPAYKDSTAASGETCQSEMRICTNGTLSGSFTYKNCTEPTGAPCYYSGTVFASGSSVTGYTSATVPEGQSCVKAIATCNNGSVTGGFASPFCTPMSSSLKMEAMNSTFETVMSETPNLILVLFDHYGPHIADLTLIGTAPDYPGFRITAAVSFSTLSGADWVLKNISVENLPAGFSNPVVAMDAWSSFSSFNSRFVSVGSGGNGRYRMTWTISGQASPQVRPVYLPRMSSMPWLGKKHGYFAKIRGNEPLNPAAFPFDLPEINQRGEPDGVKAVAAEIVSSLNAQSNNLVEMDYEIKEFQSLLSPEEADCSILELGNDKDLRKRTLERNGVTLDNFKALFDWIIYSYYPSYGAQFKNSCLDLYTKAAYGGGSPPDHKCPMCGPGGDVSFQLASVGKLSPGSGPYIHELAHGLSLHDQYANVLGPCEHSDPLNVAEAQLFRIDHSCQFLVQPLWEQAMGGNYAKWLDPIERSILGWLSPAQVKTVSTSGIYDLYTDNDDLTSDSAKPLILQLAIKRQGKIDFIYVITFNRNVLNKTSGAMSGDEYDYYANSIRLSTSGDHRLGLAWASGGSQNFYSFVNNSSMSIDALKHPIPAGVDVRINFGDTDITLRLIDKINNRARVRVTYNKPLLDR